MGAAQYFSRDYAEARAKFRAAVQAAGGKIETRRNNAAKGPGGEELTTDIARFGSTRAKSLLWLNSGTHGIEGYCGSGAQGALLAGGLAKRLPKGVALLLTHAINPCGFAWGRRVNESNIDLNRNFVDHRRAHPANPGYAKLHQHVLPADWDGPARAAADRGIAAFVDKEGMAALQAAVTLGQYDFPDGLFYGGRKASWSNKTFQALARQHGEGMRQVLLLDFHTGLGPSGHGELIFAAETDDPGLPIAKAWFGAKEIKVPAAGNSASAVVRGSVLDGLYKALPEIHPITVAIEYGTLPVPEVLAALRADNWLHVHGGRDHRLWEPIKREIRAAFYVETDLWKRQVVDRAEQVVARALKGLAG